MIRRLIESGRIWPYAVVGLLLLNVCVCAVTVVAATSDPVASAVEPDYYQRAVDWDDERAKWPAPEKLGWEVRVESRRGIGVVVEITDCAGGVVISGVKGRVKARHAGERLEVREAPLAPMDGGALVWNRSESDTGQWTLTLWLERGQDRALLTRTVMVED